MKTKLLLLLLFAAVCTSLSGQTPTSRIEQVTLTGVSDELVREVDSRYLITHSVPYGTPSTHRFVLHDEMFGYQYTMNCDLGMVLGVSESDYVVVKDMRVHDGKCYFCGYVRHYEGEPQYDANGNITYSGYSYKGYVAYFDLAQMCSGGGQLYSRPIPEADSLTRMAVYDPNGWHSGDVMLAAIGDGAPLGPSGPLLVELQQQGGSWTCNLLTTWSPRRGERYYDIAESDGLLRIVSGFGAEPGRSENERTSFLIHWCKRSGFYVQYAQYGMTEEAHYFPQLPQLDTNVSYRLAEMPIRLCSTMYDGCCVALGTQWEHRDVGSPLLMNLNSADQMQHAEMYGYYAMPEARELANSASTGITALLCVEHITPISERLVMSRMQAGTNVAEMMWPTGKLGSLSWFGTRHLVAAGVTPVPARRLHLVVQDAVNAMGENPTSCANLTDYSAWKSSLVQPEIDLWDWRYRHYSWVWGVSSYESSADHPRIICNKSAENTSANNNNE